MGQSEEKTLPREGGGEGRKTNNPEQPNTLLISFLRINALQLLKVNKDFCRYVLANPVRYRYDQKLISPYEFLI